MAGCTLLAGALLAACAAPQRCAPGLAPARIAQLYFGRNVGAAEGVSEADWRAFLDEEVAPRFPEGLTVADAQGQWRAAGGGIIRERSKTVTIVLAGAPGEAAKLNAIRAAYKARFRQEAVLLLETPACAGF